MSESLYTDIRAALAAQLNTMAGAPDIAWENIEYVPTVGVPYLVPNIIMGAPVQAEVGVDGRNWETGIFQVTAQYPPGQGVAPINAMVGKIRERFKRGTRLTYNGSTVTIRSVFPGPQSITVTGVSQPVSIAFYSQAAN